MKSDYHPQVSMRDASFTQKKTYLDPVEYYSLTPHDLNGTDFRKSHENDHVSVTHLP
jgi:hypothetical protein